GVGTVDPDHAAVRELVESVLAVEAGREIRGAPVQDLPHQGRGYLSGELLGGRYVLYILSGRQDGRLDSAGQRPVALASTAAYMDVEMPSRPPIEEIEHLLLHRPEHETEPAAAEKFSLG